MPGALGYVHASMPLGVLEVAPGRLGLRIRPAFIRAVFGVPTLEAMAGQDVVVFPARRPQGLMGIEIRTPGRQSSYFCNYRRAEVLAALAAAGFEVSDQVQTMKLHR